jgi:hypothetical protein
MGGGTFCTLKGVRRIEAGRSCKCDQHGGRKNGPHPSTTATVPVSLGTFAVAVQVSQRYQYEITLADIKSVNGGHSRNGKVDPLFVVSRIWRGFSGCQVTEVYLPPSKEGAAISCLRYLLRHQYTVPISENKTKTAPVVISGRPELG